MLKCATFSDSTTNHLIDWIPGFSYIIPVPFFPPFTIISSLAKLNSNQDPLCVGGSYVNEDFTPIEGSTNFFVGHIDEVYNSLN